MTFRTMNKKIHVYMQLNQISIQQVNQISSHKMRMWRMTQVIIQTVLVLLSDVRYKSLKFQTNLKILLLGDVLVTSPLIYYT